ncbi:DUF6519 domain-containing protein [Actinoplanes sp. NPDC026619]|uniref:DUF6519 domain-containing protein n=1 Tax=Actinoplanes sp. NPDC026619 TaxID=3155798 RepID=UPI0033EB3FD6
MATDIARLSFDPSRRYTGVVPQQGRVTLEAEQGEERMIAARERRLELIDIIGPAGTPDDGYEVSSPGPAVLLVDPGTMYVGGNRVEVPAPVDILQQPDWLDGPGRGALFERPRGHVLLTVREREVTAVEDPALSEPALGGPDGAARARLVQHIEVRGVESANCAGALAEDIKSWATEGLTYDPATAELLSNTRLQVSWQTPAGGAGPCEPAATGGYLGAENQVIRVQITAVDAAAGSCELIWGYDNASMLYRVVVDGGLATVTLQRRPVDEHHWPRAGQAVQVLRSTARLRATDGVDEGFVAALGGHVGLLATSYDPGTKQVSFPAPIPNEYVDGRPTYLRVWEQRVTGVRPGTTFVLGDTGVQVTLTSTGGPLRVDDYWCIGVRPGTPTEVLPARLLRAPQPPDGPLVWACPLAVIDISRKAQQLTVREDCRRHYPPPVPPSGGGCCCTIEVHPEDAKSGKLQELIDAAIKDRQEQGRAGRITVCFAPGRYQMVAPLVLAKNHSGLRLKACSDGVVLSVFPGAEERFGQGMIVLTDATDVAIKGFAFLLPSVPRVDGRVRGTPGGVLDARMIRGINALAIANSSIGIRPVYCMNLEISDCLFEFPLEVADTFGVAIYPLGTCREFRILRNQFRYPRPDDLASWLEGFTLTDTAASMDSLTGKDTAGRARFIGDVVMNAAIDDSEFTENTFSGLASGVFIEGEVGLVRVQENTFRNCGFSIDIKDMPHSGPDLKVDFLDQDVDRRAVTAVRDTWTILTTERARSELRLIAVTYPLPVLPEPPVDRVSRLDAENLAALRAAAAERRRAWTEELVRKLAAEHPRRDGDGERIDVLGGLTSLPAEMQRAADGVGELFALSRLEESVSRPRVSVVGNDVESGLQLGGASALILFIDRRAELSAATVTGNRLSGSKQYPVAFVGGFQNATIVGNMCLTDKEKTAISVSDMERLAVSGNVFAGVVSLPARQNVAAPGTWEFLNDVKP